MLLADAGGFASAMKGRTIQGLTRLGPFLVFALQPDAELIMHCMLAGRLQIAAPEEKPIAHVCFGLRLDSGEWLRYGDDKLMGKVYLTAASRYDAIPATSPGSVSSRSSGGAGTRYACSSWTRHD